MQASCRINNRSQACLLDTAYITTGSFPLNLLVCFIALLKGSLVLVFVADSRSALNLQSSGQNFGKRAYAAIISNVSFS